MFGIVFILQFSVGKDKTYDEIIILRKYIMENFFKLKERGTNVKTEFIAGMTTFFPWSIFLW